ncbi:MAG: histidine kinase [Pseudonocardia sp.]
MVRDRVHPKDPVDPSTRPDAPHPVLRPVRAMTPVEGGVPAGPGWGYEFDVDGLRATAYLGPSGLRLLSAASVRSITGEYPELAALGALCATGRRYVLDGKIVALDDRGLPDPAALRRRSGAARPSPARVRAVPVRYYVTDLLALDDQATLHLPYRRRRELLGELDLEGLPADLSLWFPDGDGAVMLEVARHHGLSAVLAKRLDSRYRPGRRSRAWVRTSCRSPGELPPGRGEPRDGRPDSPPAPKELGEIASEEPGRALSVAHAELRALRAQLAPHFVYNALTTISAYVRTDPPRARDLLAEFADYARYGFGPTAGSVSLGAELSNVRSYLALERARFGDRLRIVEQLDGGVLGVAVPPLTVRPLVEHAVRNAIEPAPTGGTLRISVVVEGGGCLITVAESAGGVDDERLREVVADVRARLCAAGHPDPPRVRVGDSGTSVTVRVAR